MQGKHATVNVRWTSKSGICYTNVAIEYLFGGERYGSSAKGKRFYVYDSTSGRM